MYIFPFLGLDTQFRIVVAKNLRNMIDSPNYKWTKDDPNQSTHFYNWITVGAILSLVTLVLALMACVFKETPGRTEDKISPVKRQEL